MIMNRKSSAIRAIATLLLVLATVAHAQVIPDRAQLERRKTSVETLIERSSAAKQVETSGSPAAQAIREKARASHRAAVQAMETGDHARAGQLFDEATRSMVQAVREAAPGQLIEQKARRDYEARLESVKALLAAQKRISSEKSSGAGDTATGQVEKLMAQAQQLAAENDLVRARSVLDEAYLAVRGSIGGMREGDTLVRSLHFANKEEEYHYEVDRNDTHRMLVTVLLSDKPAAAAGTEPSMQRAAQLRLQAEAAAARRDFAGAIEFLEQSTRELVRAIRGAGVYIPG
jgi:hypothetical protein